VRTCK